MSSIVSGRRGRSASRIRAIVRWIDVNGMVQRGYLKSREKSTNIYIYLLSLMSTHRLATKLYICRYELFSATERLLHSDRNA